MFAFGKMMSLSLMMFPSEMMSAPPNVVGKHHIIARKTSNIMFAKQMHHVAAGDISLKYADISLPIKGIFLMMFAFGKMMTASLVM